MLYQNDLKPLTVQINTQAFAITATVKADTLTLGDLIAFPLNRVYKYYYESLLRSLKIQEELPDFETKIRVIKPNIIIETTIDTQIITDVLTCGTTFPASNRLTNNQKRITIDTPFQVVYFIKEDISEHLYGSVNNGEYIDLGLIKILDVATTGGFIIINYHKFYAELSVTEADVINFKFSIYTQSIKFDAIHTDFPFYLVMRNQYGFFDCFRTSGNKEYNLEFQNNSIDSYTESRMIYNETTEKLSVQTGLLEQNEKVIITENLRNLDFFEYRNGTLLRLISEMKAINKLATKDAQDTLKLDFRYASNTRRYL